MPPESDTGRTITIIAPSPLDSVQGSTEAYYVTRELGKYHDVHLFSHSPPGFDNICYHNMPESKLPALFGLNMAKIPIFVKHLRDTNTDILYTYRGLNIGAYFAAQAANCHWIVDLQTPPTNQDQEFSKLTNKLSTLRERYLAAMDASYQVTLPKADAVITLSDGIKDELTNKYGVNDENVALVPLGVDLNKFDPDNYKDTIQTPPYDCVYLGSIAEFRGLDTMLEGVAAQDDIHDSIRIHIIGDGPKRTIESLQQRATRLGISDIVKWHGLIDHDKIPEKLAKMDIALSPLPALDSFEVSSPAKLFEYLAMGLPVVCSDITPHRNVLTPDITGFFHPSDDVEGFASALTNAITHVSSNNENIESQIRRHAEEHSWRKRVQVIDSVFNEI